MGEKNLLKFRYHEFEMLDHPWGETADNFPRLPDVFPWFQLISIY